jgi:hypothetical protein
MSKSTLDRWFSFRLIDPALAGACPKPLEVCRRFGKAC